MLKWNKNCAKLTCSVTCSKISRDRRSEPSRWIWMLHEKWPLPKHTHKSTNKQILPGSNIPPLYKSSCYGKTDWLASRQFPDPQLTKSRLYGCCIPVLFLVGVFASVSTSVCLWLYVCCVCVRACACVFFLPLFLSVLVLQFMHVQPCMRLYKCLVLSAWIHLHLSICLCWEMFKNCNCKPWFLV